MPRFPPTALSFFGNIRRYLFQLRMISADGDDKYITKKEKHGPDKPVFSSFIHDQPLPLVKAGSVCFNYVFIPVEGLFAITHQ